MGLTLADYARAAAALGCEPRVVQALATVESAGSGFLPDGRPELLFEAHNFHRLTGGRYDGRADRRGVSLSSPTWDRSLYGAGGTHQWDRHNDAALLNAGCADMSCSWGAFQIMGENFHMVGFRNVTLFVGAMQSGVAAQLDAFVAFIKSSGLTKALIARDWAAVARGYNGPGNVPEYAAKMAAAYAAAGGVAPVPDPEPPESEADILNQAQLDAKG